MYLLTLSGQGDRTIALVDKEIWDWVNLKDTPGREPGQTGWVDTAAPARVKAAHTEAIEVTSGSYRNDRALWVTDDVDGVEMFDSQQDVRAYLKAHPEIEIDGEYEGYIY